LEDNQTLCKKVSEYKDMYVSVKFDIATTPPNKYQKREQDYVKKRKEFLPFLDFANAPIQSDIYDFTVNGKRVQEKVISLHSQKHHSYAFQLSCGHKHLRRTYRLGENDFYWFHSSIDHFFWIVPESILYERGILSRADTTLKNKRFSVHSKKPNWLDAYKFDYMNLTESCISRIKGMFSIL
jgi:hypothetical protein